MKLTEKQLADIFTNSTKANETTNDAGDCLDALPASSARLTQAEGLLNDFAGAQGMKMAVGMKQWSQVMADSIHSSQQSWFSFLGMNSPFKTAVATVAFAVAFVVAMPEFKQNNPSMMPIQHEVADDVISSNPFEGSSDVLSKGGFDASNQSNDTLFDASFG